MKHDAPIILGLVSLVIGFLMATGWQYLVASSFTSSGAALITTDLGALPAEKAGIILLTGTAVLLAVLLKQTAEHLTGRCIWPLWGIFLALLIGENLGIGLRLVTLATVSLPAAIELAGTSTPIIDLSNSNLIAWAAAGLASGGVISLGLLVAMGGMED